jgi:hypothetical protein
MRGWDQLLDGYLAEYAARRLCDGSVTRLKVETAESSDSPSFVQVHGARSTFVGIRERPPGRRPFCFSTSGRQLLRWDHFPYRT